MNAPQYEGDGADRVGRAISSVFVVLLAALFAYGFVWPIFFQ